MKKYLSMLLVAAALDLAGNLLDGAELAPRLCRLIVVDCTGRNV